MKLINRNEEQKRKGTKLC